MGIAKQERFEQETAIFELRNEAGVRAVQDWLQREEKEANQRWRTLKGDELIGLQSEAKLIARLLKVIEQDPRFKPKEENK